MSENNVTDFRFDEGIPEQDRNMLEESLRHYIELRESVRVFEEEMKLVRERIVADLNRLGIEKTRYEAYAVSLRVQERRTLDRGKLLDLGVSPELLRKAEQVTQSVVLDIREQRGRR